MKKNRKATRTRRHNPYWTVGTTVSQREAYADMGDNAPVGTIIGIQSGIATIQYPYGIVTVPMQHLAGKVVRV